MASAGQGDAAMAIHCALLTGVPFPTSPRRMRSRSAGSTVAGAPEGFPAPATEDDGDEHEPQPEAHEGHDQTSRLKPTWRRERIHSPYFSTSRARTSRDSRPASRSPDDAAHLVAVSDGRICYGQALAEDAPELGGHVMDGLLVHRRRRGGAGEQQQRGEHPREAALTTAP